MKGNEKLHGQTSCSLKHRQLAERRSCCVVEQTSKAAASNSFSVTLCDPAAPLFLHMHTDHTNHVWCALAHPLTHSAAFTLDIHAPSPLKLSIIILASKKWNFASFKVDLPSSQSQYYSPESVTVVLTLDLLSLWNLDSLPHRHHWPHTAPPKWDICGNVQRCVCY